MNPLSVTTLRSMATALGCLGLLACATTSGTQPTPIAESTTVVVEKKAAEPEREPPPASGPRTDARFPAIARSSTQNGLELNAVHLPTLPIVKIKLVVRSGSATDPAGMPGIAQLTASMLKEGTQRKSSQKLAEAVDFLGAHLSVASNDDTLSIDMQALSEHFDAALALVAEIALSPAFKQDELDKLKKRELARLELQSQDPHFLAQRELHAALYGNHPYAHIDTTEQVIKRVKRQDLMRWHQAHFAPNNAFLVVAGSVPPERVAQAAGQVFGTWKSKSIAPVVSPAPPVVSARRVVIVDRPESVQSMIYYGNLALPRGHEDFIPLTVANQVLGGSASSRLFMDLREKRSLTYGAYSDVDERVQVAPFMATAAVRTEVTDQAVAGFTEHLERIVAEPAAAAELVDAKRYLTDRFPLRIETPSKIAELVADLRVFGLADDYWDRFRERIESISAEAALAAAKRHVRPKQSLLVVVGKAAAIKPALEAYGPVTVVDTAGQVIVAPGMEKKAPAAQPAGPAAKAPTADDTAAKAK